eukprot:TRINITY_DN211_c0_g2_i1.p1 TRINITY_DN211_c0_g2~~TRINITY_DN211_c0_g2_i1.p1  ORF type:complete len:426 (+),score=47.80 TRINITY_DN211_c0_g2_i1:108-1385(+)
MTSASARVEPAENRAILPAPFAQEHIAAWGAILRRAAPRIRHHGEHQSPPSVDGEQGSENTAGPESSDLHEVLLQVCMPFIKQMLLALQTTMQEEVMARSECYKTEGKSPRDEAEVHGAFEKSLSANSGTGRSDGNQAFEDEFRKGASQDPQMTSPDGRASVNGVQKVVGGMNSTLPEGSESDESETEQEHTHYAKPMPYLKTPSTCSIGLDASLDDEAEGHSASETSLSANSGTGSSDGDQAFEDEFSLHDPRMASPEGRASASRVQNAPGVMKSMQPEGPESDWSETEQERMSYANPMPYLRTPSMSSICSGVSFEELTFSDHFDSRLKQVLLQRIDAVGGSSIDAVGGSSTEGHLLGGRGKHGADDTSNTVCRHWFSKGWCRLSRSCRFLHPVEERGVGLGLKRSKPRHRPRDALAPGLVNH